MPLRTDGPSYETAPHRFPAARAALPDFTAAAASASKALPAYRPAVASKTATPDRPSKSPLGPVPEGAECLQGCKRRPVGLGKARWMPEERPLCQVDADKM